MQIKDGGAVTDLGRGRTFNEDSVLLLREPVLGAIANGIGGPGAGNVAAAMTTLRLQRASADLARQAEHAANLHTSEARLAAGQALEAVVHDIHREIARTAAQQHKPGMMATVVAALVAGDHATIAHVGAARAYLFRAGTLRLLTEDHSLAMLRLRQGRMSAAEFDRSPLRTQLYQALGSGNDVDVDISEVALADDDWLVLCSDGVHTRLGPEQIVQCLDVPDPGHAAARLVQHAKAAGADDDVSAVVMHIGAAADSALLEEIRAVLAETFLFAGLSDAERTLVAPYLDHTWLQPAQVLFSEGDPGDAFYVVVDGAVRITKGGTHLVDVTAGGNFGELCLARQVPRSATVTALSDTLVFGLSRQRFLEISRRKPSLGARIATAALEVLGDRLRDLTDRLAVVEDLSNGDVDRQGLTLADAVSLAARGRFTP